MKNKLHKKRWFDSNSPTLDCIGWSLENNLKRKFSVGVFTIRIGKTDVVIHSTNDYDKDLGLVKFENKLHFLIEKIDEFITLALNHNPKKPNHSIRYWLNPNKGSEAEFTGYVSAAFEKHTATFTIASCDRSLRFYIPTNKELKKDSCFFKLTQIKLALSACIHDIQSLRPKDLQK